MRSVAILGATGSIGVAGARDRGGAPRAGRLRARGALRPRRGAGRRRPPPRGRGASRWSTRPPPPRARARVRRRGARGRGRRRAAGARVRRRRRAERDRRRGRAARDAGDVRRRRRPRAGEQGEPGRRRRAGDGGAAPQPRRAILPVDSEHSALCPVPRAAPRRGAVAGARDHRLGRARSGAGRASSSPTSPRRAGARPPHLDDGREDHDRLGHADEQGARGDRGPPPVRRRLRPHRGGRPPAVDRARHGALPRRRAARARRACPTCACRSRGR